MSETYEAACWLALLGANEVKRALAKQVIYRWCVEQGQPLGALFAANQMQAQESLEMGAAQVAPVLATRQYVAAQEALLRDLEREGAHLLLRTDAAYPEALTERLAEERLPYFFCYQGDPAMLTQPTVGVFGAAQPTVEAQDAARALARELAAHGYTLVGGYGRGVDRLAFDEAILAGGHAAAILPLGLRQFEHRRALKSAVEAGRALLLSPYAPDTPYQEPLAAARLALALALPECLALAAPDAGPSEAPWAEFVASRRRALIWSGGEQTPTGDAWVQAGAWPYGDPATALRLAAEVWGAAPDGIEDISLDDAPFYESDDDHTPIAFADADQAIEALGRSGKVPPALARRLRESRWPDDDPD